MNPLICSYSDCLVVYTCLSERRYNLIVAYYKQVNSKRMYLFDGELMFFKFLCYKKIKSI